jgi:hypothetical protein
VPVLEVCSSVNLLAFVNENVRYDKATAAVVFDEQDA